MAFKKVFFGGVARSRSAARRIRAAEAAPGFDAVRVAAGRRDGLERRASRLSAAEVAAVGDAAKRRAASS